MPQSVTVLRDPDNFKILNRCPAVFQFLSSDPNEVQSNGFINAKGNYSDAGLGATDFCITAKPGEFLLLERMLVTVRDEGSFDSGFYGNSIVLTNGIRLLNGFKDSENNIVETFDITEGLPIKTNPDWGAYCYDVTPSSYGQGDETLNVRWTFSKMGRPVILDGDAKYQDQTGLREFACIRLNDDFTGLKGHYFQIQGVRVKK